jgi:hypothetical protein
VDSERRSRTRPPRSSASLERSFSDGESGFLGGFMAVARRGRARLIRDQTAQPKDRPVAGRSTCMFQLSSASGPVMDLAFDLSRTAH